MKNVGQILQDHSLKRTSLRLSVLGLFVNHSKALGVSDFDDELDSFDRVTLYRTLRTFEEKGIIHKVMDGHRGTKYALCADQCTDHEHHDEHVHFHCNECGETICLSDVIVPSIKVPAGFAVHHEHTYLEGVCDHCNHKI